MRLTNMLFILFAFVSSHVCALTTHGNQILDGNGNPIALKGINWFGFNDGSTMVDGLWAGPDDLSLDFATVVYRMQLLGFNAVRLPFSFADLYTLTPRDYRQNAAPTSQSEIQASVTDSSAPANGTIPAQQFPAVPINPNVVNSYLPNDSTLHRFLWIVNFFARNGFYVLIDNHLREDQTVLQKGKDAWIQDWVQLVTAISQDPVSKEMLMLDCLNEPDNFGIRWEATGSTPALADLYLSLMDALYAVNPRALFFIEGTGQGGIGANWGDGFAVDPTLISQYGLSDPRPFFNALLQKPYLNQVVISPHVYPPSVTGATSNYSGLGLWNRLSSSFGYLTQKGYCNGSTCKVFPVALGEFGSRFVESQDLQSMADIATYLQGTGTAADGRHMPIGNWFYWAWNANSGDTGGIVNDDWRQILWTKVEYLRTIGLTPWYAVAPPPTEYGTLCLSVSQVSGLTPNLLQPISVKDYMFSITNFATPVCEQMSVGSYTITPPSITVGNTQFTALTQNVTIKAGASVNAEIQYIGTSTPNPTAVTVTVQLGTPWQEGEHYNNVLNLYVTNQGASSIDTPWQLTVANSSYIGVSSFWNLQVQSVTNGAVSAAVESSWEALAPNGGNTVNVGMIISSSSSNFIPTSVTINGAPAKVVLSQ